MTDNLRESAGDKLSSNLKPDSEKSTLEKGQEQVKGAADSAASTVQPEGDKSIGQKATDTASGTGDQGNSVLGSAQETLGNAASSVQETLGMGKK